MKQTTPYFTFDGNAREALEYYKDIFNGEILELKTYGEANYPTPPEANEKIIHGKFQKDEFYLMVSDAFPSHSVSIGNNISFVLEFEREEELQTIYDRLYVNSTVVQELQDTFWGAKYAKVKDPFGIVWDLSYTNN
ncbi:VOC family protein [Lederbergia lenta]|uniref:Putative 3-demethylubiquinone-9 3-methyltransferase n=1 Tax=Lederbergia lenta TaxID=1467 RepID=A0A2X4WF68_LEDLE|nr:VOC family protein [Lederbergia lenta]MCM3113011.1 VOC family protein [Lederbergia lenta]MEC2322737.1 VOC family protein [Lederbergia lenta]SQI61693.1 putative 3-demethylubiquinone-9 3-methyltransferase [Lederbergia lenta]